MKLFILKASVWREANRNLSLWVSMFSSGCGPTGLLAGMWEFPSLLLEEENSEVKQQGALCAEVGRLLGVKVNRDRLSYVGEVSAIPVYTLTNAIIND